MHDALIALPRAGKQIAVMLLDVVLSILSTWLAFSLRLETLHWPTSTQWWVYLLAPALTIPVFVRFGLYRAIFRYTGIDALMTIAKAVTLYASLLFAIVLWQHGLSGVPRSVGILQPLIFLVLAGGSRALARFWLAGISLGRVKSEGRLLIYGAGEAGVQTAAAIANARQFHLVGFLDDAPAKIGRSINGATVYAPKDTERLVARHGVTDILLALPSASRARRNAIIKSLSGLPVHVRTLPGMSDLASGRVSLRDLKELDIEDLLARDATTVDTALLAGTLSAQVVLVTGAGGSIGSELCRQILLERPAQMLLFDHNEFGLYSIHQELQALSVAKMIQVVIVPLLGSVTNLRRLQEVCRSYRPAWIYHAAAYKHVPIVESNPAEGMSNNVFGSLNVARAAIDAGVANFVLVSSDKAVRPTNVMGASKRMAELVLQALNAKSGVEPTRFSMVRFGNVLGSSGSVVPLFRAQLEAGGPLTVTHPEVTRYFMTIAEAARLVLHAGAMAQGGEVFVLDMGEPVKIIDLARRMIELSGLTVRDDATPDGDIGIEIIGLRRGEKLYEELLIGENPTPSAHPRIMMAQEEFLPWAELHEHLTALHEAVEQGDVVAIKMVLATCVNGYDHLGNAGHATKLTCSQ